MSAQPAPEAAAAAANLCSAFMRGIPSARNVVHLVPKVGEKVPVHEQVLKNSSEFFKAALEIRMSESG